VKSKYKILIIATIEIYRLL